MAGIDVKYLGEAVVLVHGSYDEKLGEDGTLTGKGAKPAQITVYGVNNEDDIVVYCGLIDLVSWRLGVLKTPQVPQKKTCCLVVP